MNEIDKHKLSPQDDFEQWLTEQLHDGQPYLDDDGFSDQVLAAVAVAPRTRYPRPLVWATLLALGCLILIAGLFPGWAAVSNLATALLTLPLLTLLQIGLGLGLGISTLGALAIWRECVR